MQKYNLQNGDAEVLLLHSDFNLKNHPLIPHSLGDPFAVEIFEERDGVFAADSGEVFEFRDIDFR